MMVNIYRDLTWLPLPPTDFNRQCRALPQAPDFARVARSLATHTLDGTKLGRLGDAIREGLASGQTVGSLTPFKLGILGNGTLDLLPSAIVASSARHGIALECLKGGFEQPLQDALDKDSLVNRFHPDAVLLALDYRGLPLAPTPGNLDAADAAVRAAVDYLNAIREGLRRAGTAICILQTLAPPPESLFGSFDRILPGTARHLIDQVNQHIFDMAQHSDDILFDVAGLADTVGLADWHSPEQWNMAKLPFDDSFVPLYADHVGRIIGALRGKSRRCLVLDLDNTLWGGVIGDDGMDGIKVAQGDATGEAHLSVQKMALALRERGIVLAVSSKNTDSVAREPFSSHPEMLVREEHIAVFQANWNDKATNIAAIAKELSLGLDAFVFLDDNPVERGLVRELLPEVGVPEVGDDPAIYARILAAAGYFEAIHFSEEDRKRAEMYQGNARRLGLEKQAVDIESYLASLDMQIVFRPFDEVGRSRIAQLISKSNQFNLTTRRYSEVDIGELEKDPAAHTLQVRLVDKFGDNGMISVIICRHTEPDSWIIDTWLMSCRVLGRRVEQAVLKEIVELARASGIRQLIGVYRPTPRNAMVSEHYSKLGFTRLDDASGGDGETRWALPTSMQIAAPPMRVDRFAALLVAAGA
jgi:FkbH-like protein